MKKFLAILFINVLMLANVFAAEQPFSDSRKSLSAIPTEKAKTAQKIAESQVSHKNMVQS